jgi:TatA/E family protein of Tat protein translocase
LRWKQHDKNYNFKKNDNGGEKMLGTTEIVLIVLAILVLFGGKKIPELAKGLGASFKEFKKAIK